ncbi:hypothetical protein JCM31267_14560 [Blautia wexlerae]
MFIGNKKCRIYAACGVSQTPISSLYQRGISIFYINRVKDFKTIIAISAKNFFKAKFI